MQKWQIYYMIKHDTGCQKVPAMIREWQLLRIWQQGKSNGAVNMKAEIPGLCNDLIIVQEVTEQI